LNSRGPNLTPGSSVVGDPDPVALTEIARSQRTSTRKDGDVGRSENCQLAPRGLKVEPVSTSADVFYNAFDGSPSEARLRVFSPHFDAVIGSSCPPLVTLIRENGRASQDH